MRYAIFSGTWEDAPPRDSEGPLWLESVNDLNVAIRRMEELARETPGRYFVYNTAPIQLVAKFDSRAAQVIPMKERKTA